MILITTAMMMEARPIAERLGLSPHGNEAIPTFSNKTFYLVVSGVGTLRASCATGWSLGHLPGIQAAINLGFCGGASAVTPLHQWNYINAVRDLATGRLSVPDILWKHPFPEIGLLTSAKVVDSFIEDACVVDMEGSGFFEAARQFLPPDRIVLLKWVSDALTGKIDVEETGRAYAASLDPVMSFLQEWSEVFADKKHEDPDSWFISITKRIRLSESQSLFLDKWLSGYRARGGDLESLLCCLPDKPPTTKRENNQVFERLKDALKG